MKRKRRVQLYGVSVSYRNNGYRANVLQARTIFITGARPLTSGTSGRTATMLPMSGFWMLMAIIVTVTATMIDAQAKDDQQTSPHVVT